jgi:uncharacterized membrane protein (UPF0182 family)
MNILKRKLTIALMALLGILIVVASLIYLSVDFLVNFWWYDELDRSGFFILREFYRDIIGVGFTLIFAALIYTNFRIVARVSKNSRPAADSDGSSTIRGRLIRAVAGGSPKIHILLSLVLALPVLIPVYDNWERFLLFLSGSRSGVQDPAFGKDLSFYFFDYPVYSLIQWELLVTFLLILCVVYLLYRIAGSGKNSGRDKTADGANIHLTVLIVILVLIQAWSIWLGRVELLYEDRHLPVFYGPGFVEMRYHLPLIWLSFFVFLALSGSALHFLYTRKTLKVVAVLAVCYLALVGLRHVSFLPNLLERFYVQPNPVKSERLFIERNIKATLAAYDLDRVKTIDFPIESSLSSVTRADVRQTLHNIPVWDKEFLIDVYDQLQALRPYFNFVEIDVDRYRINGVMRQVNIGARELNLTKLPSEAQSWQNRHLVFTHGFGVAMSPSDQQAERPMQWYLSNLSLNSPVGLQINKPEIYFGLEHYDYAIEPNKVDPAGFANYAGQNAKRYSGTAGLPVSSLLRRLVFAAYFGEPAILLSLKIARDSRLLMRRNIRERIGAIAPFLILDDDPYPVLQEQRIFWVQDAYTVSDLYPMSTPMQTPLNALGEDGDDNAPDSVNYIRNSVKIVVDAYNGTTDFYIVDPKDPIVRAYDRAYPGLFKSFDQMPKKLIPHLNYPQDLFDAQLAIYARYHQQEPEVFYQQSDLLQVAKLNSDSPDSYYLTLDLLESAGAKPIGTEKFVAMSPLSPVGRENLRKIMLAGCVGEGPCTDRYYGNVLAYNFPTNIQLEGPAQIDALIDQNPEISQQLSLWDQRGSRVLRGRIIVVPVDNSILYVQPVYLASTRGTRFPQLVRVITAMNHRVAMDVSLEAAFSRLAEQLSGQEGPVAVGQTLPKSAQSR